MNNSEFIHLLQSIDSNPIKLLALHTNNTGGLVLDLSVSNTFLSCVDVSNTQSFESFITNSLEQAQATIGIGGYLEIRNLYKRSSYFNTQDAGTERNIHLGIDLWCKVDTPVLAALDGKVHSFKNNRNYGDYGPTIILEHTISGHIFYTLYGHLSLDSLANLREGQLVNQGECIGCLGASNVNGDYPPHLHFQIIKDLQGNSGDYPGVCSLSDLEFYKHNCPDPNLLLKLS